MEHRYAILAAAAALALAGAPSLAQDAAPATGGTQAATVTETAQEPENAQAEEEGLKVYFATGSARVAGEQEAVLDQAARLFRDGNPIVMIVAGVADTVGSPDKNLDLSLARAQSVANGLTARGIPAERLQVLGRGNSELEVDTGAGVAEPDNRVAEITWR